MKRMLTVGFAFALAVGLAAPARAADEEDIVDTLAASRNHTILVTALREAGLVEMLRGKGPFTVFAPTDAAFKKLGDEQIKTVIRDRVLLKKLLQAHVVGNTKLLTKDLAALNGKDLNGFRVSTAGGLKVGDAKLTTSDIGCTNGVIHATDTVLVPTK